MSIYVSMCMHACMCMFHYHIAKSGTHLKWLYCIIFFIFMKIIISHIILIYILNYFDSQFCFDIMLISKISTIKVKYLILQEGISYVFSKWHE